MMRTAMARHTSVNDDAAAALRRAIGFAGLFGLAGIAAVACTARTAPAMTGVAADRLLVQEARWSAQAGGATSIGVPPALRTRRGDPVVAAALTEAQRQLVADRALATARRAAVVHRMDKVRAVRDLRESQRSILGIKIEQAYSDRATAQARGDAAASQALDARLLSLRIQAAKALGDAAIASRTLNMLSARIASLADADRQRAARKLAAVRSELRGG